MVNLITMTRYKAINKHFTPPPSVLFNETIPHSMNEALLSEIVNGVEGTTVSHGNPVAKFGLNYLISWNEISTGCKTAILIAYFTEKKQFKQIPLDDCGDNALGWCFKLLDDNPYVTGVLSQYDRAMHSCEPFVVSVNGATPTPWKLAYSLGVQG